MKVIKIGAIWCPGCLVMRPRWKEIESEYKLETKEYDYDLDNDIITHYNIGKKLPVAIILGENDVELERIVGEISVKKLKEIIEKYI